MPLGREQGTKLGRGVGGGINHQQRDEAGPPGANSYLVNLCAFPLHGAQGNTYLGPP